jgi:hypothetical protein
VNFLLLGFDVPKVSDQRPNDALKRWGAACAAENQRRLTLMVTQLTVTRQTTKVVLDKLGQLVAGCDAKVGAVKEQIAENERLRRDKSNAKYVRDRAKDEKKKLEKEALPEAEAALTEAQQILAQKKAEAEALVAHLEELVSASEIADAEATTLAAHEDTWAKAVENRAATEVPLHLGAPSDPLHLLTRTHPHTHRTHTTSKVWGSFGQWPKVQEQAAS